MSYLSRLQKKIVFTQTKEQEQVSHLDVLVFSAFISMHCFKICISSFCQGIGNMYLCESVLNKAHT